MRTRKYTSKYWDTYRISDFETTKTNNERINTKIEALRRKSNYKLEGCSIHAEDSFVWGLSQVFYDSKCHTFAKLKAAFKERPSLFNKMWDIYRCNSHLKTRKSCAVTLYYEREDTQCKEYVVAIQSFIKEITNSSSETFIVNSGNTAEELKKVLLAVKNGSNDVGSGCGGILEVNKPSIEKRLYEYIYCRYAFTYSTAQIEKIVHKDFSSEDLDFLYTMLKKRFNVQQGDLYIVEVDEGFRGVRRFVAHQLNGIVL